MASAAFVAIYRNALETTAQRAEVRKICGKSCARGGGQTALKITVGKLTEECAYSTPVIGQDLEIAATGRILTGTPAAVAKKAFLGLQLRVGGGGNSSCASSRARKRSRSPGSPKKASSTWRSKRTSKPSRNRTNRTSCACG